VSFPPSLCPSAPHVRALTRRIGARKLIHENQMRGLLRDVRPSLEVVARRLDRAGVLVHLPTNRIFELNETGIRVWELLSDGQDVAGIADRLTVEFEVERARAEGEVADLVSQLQHEGFIAS